MKNNTFFYFALLLVILSVLVPYIFTGFGSADDIGYSISEQVGGIWTLTDIYAKDHGRFYFYITIPYIHFAYIFNNIIISKALNTILLLGNIIMAGVVVKEAFKNKWIGFLLILFLAVFISGKGSYNPLACYPMNFSWSFLLMTTSIFFALRFNTSKKMSFVWLSAFFFFFSSLFYEAYLMYVPLLIVIVNLTIAKDEASSFLNNWYTRFKFSMPIILALLLYLTLYISFRILHPSHYLGAQLSVNLAFGKVFKTMENFASGAYPLSLIFGSHSTNIGGGSFFANTAFPTILYSIFAEHFDWILKASLIVGLYVYIVSNIKQFEKRVFYIVFSLSFLYIFLPHFPLAISERYSSSNGLPYYVTTYFAFYAVTICLISIVLFIYFSSKNKIVQKTVLVVSSLFLGISCICNDYSNFRTVQYLRQPLEMVAFMKKIANTNELKSMPKNPVIYAPQMYDTPDVNYLFSQGFEWSHYFYTVCRRQSIYFTKSPLQLDTAQNKYFMQYGRNSNTNNQYIAFTSITNKSHIDSLNESIVADTAVVYYYSLNKDFTLLFNRLQNSNDSLVVVNTDTFFFKQKNIAIAIKNKNQKNAFMRFTIKAKDIDMKSVYISETYTTSKHVVELQ